MAGDETLQRDGDIARMSRERMLSAILDSLSDAVITVGRDHRIASFNRAAERLVGMPAREALGNDCREILSANFGPEQHNCPMGDVAEGGKPRTGVDGTLRRADGRIVPVGASWAFFTDEAGE